MNRAAQRPAPFAAAYLHVALDLCATPAEAWEIALRAQALGLTAERHAALRLMSRLATGEAVQGRPA